MAVAWDMEGVVGRGKGEGCSGQMAVGMEGWYGSCVRLGRPLKALKALKAPIARGRRFFLGQRRGASALHLFIAVSSFCVSGHTVFRGD